MRKLSLLLFCISSLLCFSQSFVATPSGLVCAADETKEYVVVSFEGISAERLYQLTQNFRQKHYANPTKVIQVDITNEFLSINTFAGRFMNFSHWGVSMGVDINFTAEFSFKDGKIKIQFTNCKMKFSDNARNDLPYISNGMSWGVFDKKANPTKDLPEQYENYFNKYVSDYMLFINNYEKIKDDW